MTEWPADRVERRPVATLLPYARNARTHTPAQIDQVAASIKEFGYTNPVLVAEDNTIIAGHARVLACKKLGIAELPVMVARGWTETQRKAYVLADNKLALNAAWDNDLLKLELDDLKLNDFDLALTGFEMPEIEALFKGEPEAPDDFQSYDETMQTEHTCPKCGYQWSGGKVTRTRGETPDDE